MCISKSVVPISNFLCHKSKASFMFKELVFIFSEQWLSVRVICSIIFVYLCHFSNQVYIVLCYGCCIDNYVDFANSAGRMCFAEITYKEFSP